MNEVDPIKNENNSDKPYAPPRPPGEGQTGLNKAYEQWLANENPQTTGAFLKEADKLIDSSLKSYAPGFETRLKTQARLMALNIAKKYNPENEGKMKLSSYLMQNLQSLRRLYKRRSHPIYYPEQRILDKSKLNNLEKDFESKNGREPTLTELADISGLSHRRIEKLRTTGKELPESAAVNETGDSTVSFEQDKQKMWVDYVYFDLDPIDKKIFEWSTGYG